MANIGRYMALRLEGQAPDTAVQKDAIRDLLSAETSDVQKAAFLSALAVAGLNAETVKAFMDVVLEHSLSLPIGDVCDIVGTGGDGKNTWNVSTPASLVAAGAGFRMAKHGNRSATSGSGSADLIEQLGADLSVDPSRCQRLLDKTNFCFVFAPMFHPVLRNVAKVRKEIGHKTVFNCLGPLINPARPTHMVVGVPDKNTAVVVAKILSQIPGVCALVTLSEEGIDKISPYSNTHSWMVEPGAAEPQYRLITPAEFGFTVPTPGSPACHEGGGNATHNAAELLRVLRGVDKGQLTDFVLANAAALAVVSKKAKTFAEGVAQMRESIGSGKAIAALDEYVRTTTALSTDSSDILDRIVRRRQVEVEYSRRIVPESQLRNMKYFTTPTRDFAAAIKTHATAMGILAEIKRASPSEGDINASLDIGAMVEKYAAGGAVGVSVLTEPVWFKGSLDDITTARDKLTAYASAHSCERPAILRKDFVFSKYQILEARAYGADSVLLIVAISGAMAAAGESLQSLIAFSRSIHLEPLVEVVTESELDTAIAAGAKVIGINNRDLTTFKIDLGRTEMLMRYAGYALRDKISEYTFISLSGVNGGVDIQTIMRSSPLVKNVLIGTSLMRSANPVDLLKAWSNGQQSASGEPPVKAARQYPLFKVCGLTTPTLVISALREGADFVGLVFYDKSHRHVSDLAKARKMTQLVRKVSVRPHAVWGSLPLSVGVFMKESVENINRIAKEAEFDLVQLYGYGENEIAIDQLKRFDGSPMPVIWAVSIKDKADLDKAKWPKGIKALCIDSKVGTAVGGTGVSFDWTILNNLKVDVPLFLAGGIDESNAIRAASVPNVAVVDVSSGAETNKKKDFLKIRKLTRLVKQAIPSYFGLFGGQFVPEILIPSLMDMEKQYMRAQQNPEFWKVVNWYWKNYAGRPSLLYKATKLSEQVRATSQPGKGATIWLKREDLLHTGAHKVNNALGQAILAKWLGKTRMIAETGAGQHGVATATVCALFDLKCRVYMGAVDIERQKLNVIRMRALGAEVFSVESGSKTLNDAVNEALRDWASSSETTHYMIGSCVGPHPFPTMVRDFQSVIGQEARQQFLEIMGRLPDKVMACVGGGSNSIGMFDAFVADEDVEICGVEAGGDGAKKHSATLSKGSVGFVHGAKSFLLQDETGQVMETHSVSAGLDYPGVGPEHSYFRDMGRGKYINVTDGESIDAFEMLARTEGVLAALESSHAVAGAIKEASEMPANTHIVCCLSGRGDKDMGTLTPFLEAKAAARAQSSAQ